MKALTPAIAALALLSTAFLAVAADASKDERSVDAVNGGTNVVVTLRQNEGPRDQDVVEVSLSTATGRLDTTYTADEDEADQSATLSNQMEMLVEFHDKDGDDRYDSNEDVRSAWLLSAGSDNELNATANGTAVWAPFTVNQTMVGDEDCTHIMASAQLAGIEPPEPLPVIPAPPLKAGNLHLEAWTCGDDTSIQGHDVEATEVFVTWRVEGYQAQDQDSRLAIVFDSKTAGTLDSEDDAFGQDHAGLSTASKVGDRDATLRFFWSTSANVDNRTETVEYTQLIDERTQEDTDGSNQEQARRVFALSYPTGGNVTHAALLGSEYAKPGESEKDGLGGGMVPAPTALFALVALAGVVLVIARRRFG